MELGRIASGEARSETVIIPTGSTEQHGPHLPLGTDALIAKGLAGAVGDRIKADVAPVLSYGLSEHHMDFRGTATVKPGVYVNFISDILEAFARHDYTKIILINGHGGNIPGLTTAVQLFHRTHKIPTHIFNWWSLPDVDFPDTVKDFHAGDAETSVAMALDIELRGEPVDEMKEIPPGHKLKNLREVSRSGVLGYPTRATREKGKIIIAMVVDYIVDAVSRY